jgi:hypothetical protein
MNESIDDFFVQVSVQLLYYTDDLNNLNSIIEIMKKTYKVFYKDRSYNGGVQRSLLKQYKQWLVNSKIKHEYEIVCKKPKHIRV